MHPRTAVDAQDDSWESERRDLLGRRISDLGLRVRGSPLEALVERLYDELRAHDLAFLPPVYLSDEWGCPEAVPELLELATEFQLTADPGGRP